MKLTRLILAALFIAITASACDSNPIAPDETDSVVQPAIGGVGN